MLRDTTTSVILNTLLYIRLDTDLITYLHVARSSFNLIFDFY